MKNNELYQITVPLVSWYHKNARDLPWRSNPEPYRVWVSEIMLQQTRVEAVKPYYERFLTAFPTVESLADAPEDLLLKLWEGLGYYSRARNLQRGARVVMERFSGKIPDTISELRSLPGIGEYTAGAIASIAFQKRVPLVDGNVLRVISRVTGSYEDIAKASTKKAMAEALAPVIPAKRPGDFNQALMELGATVCLPNGEPLCNACPLSHLCRAKAQGVIHEIPVKAPKPKRKTEELTVLVIRDIDDRVALRKRGRGGLLSGMWEYVTLPGERSIDEVIEYLKTEGLTVREITPMGKAKHIFTHVEWRMTGYSVKTDDRWPPFMDCTWTTEEERKENYALPSAFRYFCR